jgi:preprotein translocase subunit SecG
MSLVITIIHVSACFFLIAVVLLQTGKGADIGAVFGGSSQTIFGSSGAGNLLTRLTTWTAAVFMLTSIFLTWDSTRHLTLSVADDAPIEPPPLEAPLENGANAPKGSAPAVGTAGTENAAPPAAGTDATAPAAPAPQADAGAAATAETAPAAPAAPAPAAEAPAPAADSKPADAKGAAAPLANPAPPAQPAPGAAAQPAAP